MTTTRINVDSRTILTDEGREYADIDIHIGDGIVLGLDGQPAVDLAIRILAHLASRSPSPAIATTQLEEAAQVIQRELDYRNAVTIDPSKPALHVRLGANRHGAPASTFSLAAGAR